MSLPLSIGKVGWIVFFICLIQVEAAVLKDEEGEIGEVGQCPNSYINKDMSWFRQNAQTLLFMEHLQQRASRENLFDWSKEQTSEKYRKQLRNLEDQFVMPEEVPDDCYERMPIPQKIAQRISFLEDRLEGCGAAQLPQPCAYGEPVVGGYGSGLVFRRLSVIQAELMRQRNVIRFMRTRLMDINRQCEGKIDFFSFCWTIFSSGWILIFFRFHGCCSWENQFLGRLLRWSCRSERGSVFLPVPFLYIG